MDFFEFSEKMFEQFLDGTLELIPGCDSNLSWQHCPEPYVWIGETSQVSEPYLCFLQINPGQPFEFQHLSNIRQNQNNPISHDKSWRENASVMGKLYSDDRNPLGINRHSISRFQKVKKIADLMGLNGVLCVEGIPLHSKNFNAHKFNPNIMQVSWLEEYSGVLTAFLRDKTVLMIDAPGNPNEPSQGRNRTVQWRRWRAEIAGINIDRVDKVKGFGGPTQTLWTARNLYPAKALYLVKGSLSLPAEEGLHKMAEAMQ